MKKKIVSALLCVAMIATMATGCGGSKSSSTSGNADSTAKQFEINAAIAANPPALDPHTVNACTNALLTYNSADFSCLFAHFMPPSDCLKQY